MIDSLINAAPYTEVQELTDAFAKFKIVNKKNEEREELVTVINKSGEQLLIITLPEIRQAPKDIKESGAYYINFISCMLGITSENVRVQFSEKFGTTIKMPVTVKSTCDSLLAAARSSTGQVGLRTVEYPSGFKSSLVGCICAQRVLRRNISMYRKKITKATNLQVLRDAVKIAFGFHQPAANPFIKSLILQTIGLMTAEDHRFFPASFYKACKEDNNVKTSEGILDRLGYSALLPAPNKVKFVSRQRFAHDENGKPIKGISGEEKLPRNQEFHAAVKILLPLIQTNDKVSLANQMKSPETHLTHSSLTFYKEQGNIVSQYGKAYAFASAFAKGKSKKTKIVHVENEVGRVSRSADSSLKTFQDASGRTFDTYMTIPYSLRKFMEKFLGRVESPKKRQRSESAAADKNEPSPMEEVSTSETIIKPPKIKKTKKTSSSTRSKDKKK